MITSTITVVLFSTVVRFKRFAQPVWVLGGAKSGLTDPKPYTNTDTNLLPLYLQVFGMLTKPLVKHLQPLSKRSSTTALQITPGSSFHEPLLNGSSSYTQDNESLLNSQGQSEYNIDQPISLRMFLNTPSRAVHHYWRKFDNAVMRRIFGGRGVSPIVPGSPIDTSIRQWSEAVENKEQNAEPWPLWHRYDLWLLDRVFWRFGRKRNMDRLFFLFFASSFGILLFAIWKHFWTWFVLSSLILGCGVIFRVGPIFRGLGFGFFDEWFCCKIVILNVNRDWYSHIGITSTLASAFGDTVFAVGEREQIVFFEACVLLVLLIQNKGNGYIRTFLMFIVLLLGSKLEFVIYYWVISLLIRIFLTCRRLRIYQIYILLSLMMLKKYFTWYNPIDILYINFWEIYLILNVCSLISLCSH